MDSMERYNAWLQDDYFDEATRNELKALSGNTKEIEERFYKDLEFGTGGLRGIMGAGTNRMNKYTVSKATQGLANYILKQPLDGKTMGVVIAYDSRHLSREFSEYTALTLNANGIKAYVFDSLRPTPVLSFAVRHLGCVAGVVITASHNPPEYSGYKCYWADGGQVPYPRDEEIITEVGNVSDYKDVRWADKQEAQAAGLFNVIGAELDEAYYKNVIEQSVQRDVIQSMSDDMTIVYTPLHGTGNIPVRTVLARAGFKNVHVVPEQELPDADFSTVGYPNPEDSKVFDIARRLAANVNADIIVGTDPDADRMGIVVKDAAGEYVVLTGNMTGVLLTHYMLSQKKASGTLPGNATVIKTIVTTEMIRPIADDFGTEVIDVLTGFKYIGEKIKQFEETQSNTFIFGFEESYGYLAGTYSRDKDAVVATLLICELAAFLKSQGKTLFEGLCELYAKYGYYREAVRSITLQGIEGVEKIKAIMESLRSNAPASLAGVDVVRADDYKSSVSKNNATGEELKITLPVSDVLHYTLADGSWACVRPSGTEPKIKIYFGVRGDTEAEAVEKETALVDAVMALI